MPESEYILITHASLMTSTQALAAHRSGQGYSVAVIDVDDLYHEFNDGILVMARQDGLGPLRSGQTLQVSPRLLDVIRAQLILSIDGGQDQRVIA